MPARRAAVIAVAVVVAGAGALVGCGRGDPAASAAAGSSGASWSTIATVDGASLTRLSLGDGSHAYLQQIDLRRMRIEQVVGERDSHAAVEAGRYYPGAPSPRFNRIAPRPALDECRSTYGPTIFSMVNFAFFEEYDASTRLSFPVKAHAGLLTGGSSPYGPVDAPIDPYYRGVTLEAFTWTDSGATISPYNPKTGAPLNNEANVNGLVTYGYRDHPSYVLSHDPPNRYQLLALADPQHVLILTVEHATLDTAAAALRARGAIGEILTFNGGISTYLWQASLGQLVAIGNSDGALPHYLCVLSR